MAERNSITPAGVMSWRLLGICTLFMVGAIGVALLLIEQLSLRAAIQGGLIAWGSIVGTQLGLRWVSKRKGTAGRS